MSYGCLYYKLHLFIIRGYKGQKPAGTWCCGFLVPESRCRGFSVLESQCYGFLSSEKRPWNHDFLAYLSPFLDFVVFPNLVVPESWSRSFLVLKSRCRGFLVLESQCRGTSFSLSSWKQKKSRIIMSIMLFKNISIDQIYATSICIMYA